MKVSLLSNMKDTKLKVFLFAIKSPDQSDTDPVRE